MSSATEYDISDSELDATDKRGREYMASAPLAASARYDAETQRLVIELKNGSTFAVPARLVQGLADATDAQRSEIEVWGDGYALRWESLDLDFTVPGLVSGVFGTRRYMASLAGRTTSPAKAAAARANGAKGGRPKKAASS
jgi:hypothetical protein